MLFGNPERINPALSPDGSRLAWVAPHGGVLNLWIADLAATARPVTADTGRGIADYRWAPDGTSLLYAQDQAGDQCVRLFAVDPGRPPHYRCRVHALVNLRQEP